MTTLWILIRKIMNRSFKIHFFWITGIVVVFSAAIVCAQLFGGVIFLGGVVALCSLAGAILFVITGVSVMFGAPYLPTAMHTVREMVSLAELKPGDRFVDLGSGDGRLVIAAAHAGAFAVGYEVNPYLWAFSWWKIFRAGQLGRAKVYLNCFWGVQFSDYDVVTLFFIKNLMPRMEKKLRTELRPGARVISAIFQFPTWAVDAQNGRGVYRYRQ